jgi:hypothetical protein
MFLHKLVGSNRYPQNTVPLTRMLTKEEEGRGKYPLQSVKPYREGVGKPRRAVALQRTRRNRDRWDPTFPISLINSAHDGTGTDGIQLSLFH